MNVYGALVADYYLHNFIQYYLHNLGVLISLCRECVNVGAVFRFNSRVISLQWLCTFDPKRKTRPSPVPPLVAHQAVLIYMWGNDIFKAYSRPKHTEVVGLNSRNFESECSVIWCDKSERKHPNLHAITSYHNVNNLNHLNWIQLHINAILLSI